MFSQLNISFDKTIVAQKTSKQGISVMLLKRTIQEIKHPKCTLFELNVHTYERTGNENCQKVV